MNIHRKKSLAEPNLRSQNDSSFLINCDDWKERDITPKKIYIEQEPYQLNSISDNVQYNDKMLPSVSTGKII